MNGQICPFCEKELKDVLKHISVFHNVTNMEEVANQVKSLEEEDRKSEAFSLFTRELNQKLLKKEITGENYRDEVKKWYDEKRWLKKDG